MCYGNSQTLVEAAAGAGQQQVWVANSIYDPDVTGGGHQPLYYDQLLGVSGPYRRFTVTKAHFNFRLANVTTTPITVGIYLNVGPIDYPSIYTLLEKPKVIRRLIGVSSGIGTTQINFHIDVAKALGVPRRKLIDDDVYSGFYNSNPSQMVYAVVMVYGMGALASCMVITRIRYTGVLFDTPAIGPS